MLNRRCCACHDPSARSMANWAKDPQTLRRKWRKWRCNFRSECELNFWKGQNLCYQKNSDRTLRPFAAGEPCELWPGDWPGKRGLENCLECGHLFPVLAIRGDMFLQQRGILWDPDTTCWWHFSGRSSSEERWIEAEIVGMEDRFLCCRVRLGWSSLSSALCALCGRLAALLYVNTRPPVKSPSVLQLIAQAKIWHSYHSDHSAFESLWKTRIPAWEALVVSEVQCLSGDPLLVQVDPCWPTLIRLDPMPCYSTPSLWRRQCCAAVSLKEVRSLSDHWCFCASSISNLFLRGYHCTTLHKKYHPPQWKWPFGGYMYDIW